MNRTTPSSRPDTQADGRDGRVVGEEDDNVLESIGKAIVAPVEGADEDPAKERPFTDLMRSALQGEPSAVAPASPRTERPR